MHLPRRDVVKVGLGLLPDTFVAKELAAVGDHHADTAGVAGDDVGAHFQLTRTGVSQAGRCSAAPDPKVAAAAMASEPTVRPTANPQYACGLMA